MALVKADVDRLMQDNAAEDSTDTALGEELRAAFAADTEDPEAAGAEAPGAPEQPEGKTSDDKASGDKASEGGEDAEGEDAEGEDAEGEVSEDAEGKASDDKASEDGEKLDPPSEWSQDDQKLFRDQSREAQEFLLRRHRALEDDYSRRSQEVAPLHNASQQWTPYLQHIGADPATAFDLLMRTEHTLRTGDQNQKLDMINRLAQQYGVEFGQGDGQQAEAGADDDLMDPSVKALRDQVSQLKGQLQSVTQTQQQSVEERQNAEQQRIAGEIQEFRQAKTETGEFAHPHFDELQSDIARLAVAERQAGRTPELGALYEQAAWANPTTRARKLEQQQNQHTQKQTARKRTKAQRAQKASSSIQSAPSGAGEDAELDLRSMLEQQFQPSGV